MAQTGCLVVCGDAGEALGDSIYEARLYVRGSVASLGADCVEKELRDEHVAQLARPARGGRDRRRPGGVPPLRLGAAALHLQGRQRGRVLMSATEQRPWNLRESYLFDRTVIAEIQRAATRGDLRHPRLRREAAAPALRRPALPRRVDLALSARGLPRALRDRRRARHALREEAARAEDPGHDRGDELRRALRAGEGGARPRRDRGRHLDDDGRRRHDAGGARALEDARLPAPAVALRDEPGRPAQGRRDRGRRRPGREAGRRRDAARPQDLRPRRRDALAARRASTSARRRAIPTGPGRTTSRSRSTSSARSPTGRSRSSSRSARRGRTTTSSSR